MNLNDEFILLDNGCGGNSRDFGLLIKRVRRRACMFISAKKDLQPALND